MIEIKRYIDTYKNEWDTFIKESKNGLFFFQRDFMDYHSDKFTDHSLFIYNKSSLVAVLPANESEDTIFSHQGLTFGSLIMSKKIKATEVLEIFSTIKFYYKEKGFNKIIYKTIPYIFHSYPSQEDIYALYRNNAKLIRRDISSIIEIDNKLDFNENKTRLIKKAQKAGVEIEENNDFSNYWRLLSSVLEKYNTKPVHSIEEITLLKEKFPENIRLFEAKLEGELIAGTVLFDFGNTIHTQYLATSEKGGKLGGLDFVNYYLIEIFANTKKFYSFGISTEQNGNYLNEGLIDQKERMGGRGIVLDTYEINI